MVPLSQRSWALALAGGCALGIRGLGSGLLLVASRDARRPIALRVGFDVSDAARYGRGRPAVLAMTLGFAVLGAAGLLAKRG